jgi:hypothetical protein
LIEEVKEVVFPALLTKKKVRRLRQAKVLEEKKAWVGTPMRVKTKGKTRGMQFEKAWLLIFK